MRRRTAWIGGAIAILAGCELIAGITDRTLVGGPDGGGEGGPRVCGALPPDPPGGADDTDLPPIDLAVSTFIVDATDAGVLIGYDLDCLTSSCAGGQTPIESCKRLPPQNRSHCDDDAGRDLEGTELFKTLSSFGAIGFSNMNALLAAGNSGVILRVTEYNGKPNDPHVKVAVYSSNGTQTGLPKWDGTDVWKVDTESILSLSAPDAYAPAQLPSDGWVTNGVLAAQFDSLTIELAAPGDGGALEDSIPVALTKALVTATLVQQGSIWKVTDGQFGGRWPLVSLLTGLQAVRGLSNEPLCGDASLSYNTAKNLICSRADLNALPDDDKAADKPCSALSVALVFQATSAKLGNVTSRGKAPQLCGPGWSDDCPK